MTNIINTREEWLGAAAFSISEWFSEAGYTVPAKIRFACSWPAGSRGGKKTLGQCVAPEASSDGHTEVYVAPTIDKPGEVLGVLAHELVHAAVGVRHGHKAPFKSACDKLGLIGSARQALPGAALTARLERLAEALGPYPHGKVDLNARQKQGTRMLKAVCPELKDKKGNQYSVRMTRSWIEMFGLPYSPKVLQPDGSYLGGRQMRLVDDAPDGDE